MPGIAYDLIADVPGLDMIRLQVKTKKQTWWPDLLLRDEPRPTLFTVGHVRICR